MNKVFIIAEAGVNHNGDINIAKRLIKKAKEAGADAVKFQTWNTDLLVTKNAKQAKYQSDNTGIKESQYDMLKKLEFTHSEFVELKNYCDLNKIIFLSTPDEIESADFLYDLQPTFKIGSGELTNIHFLQHIGRFKKKVILSTGMGTLGEIEMAIETLSNAGTRKDQITILHATTSYPTPVNEVNLKAIETLRNAFKVNVGYSDHTEGIEISVAAAALGATVIEKHFTLSKGMEGPDHRASIEPDQLSLLVRSIRNVEKAIGDGVKGIQSSERDNLKIVRKSIVAKRRIEVGETLSEDNMTAKRVGDGISTALWKEIIGLKANRAYEVDDLIQIN